MTRPDALGWLTLREPQPVRELLDASPMLRAATLDGVVVEVWPGHLRAVDLGVGPADRARAVVADVPRGSVVARRSAVWVHTGAFRPDELEVVCPGRRGSTPRARVHADVLGPDDVVDVGGVAVTSPERTAVDVARWGPAGVVPGWLAELRRTGLRDDVVAALLEASSGRPGVVRARRLLAVAPAVSEGRSGGPGRAAGSKPGSRGAPHR